MTAMPGALGKVREKPRGWWILTILAIAIALYGLRHAFLGERAFVAVLADSFRAERRAMSHSAKSRLGTQQSHDTH